MKSWRQYRKITLIFDLFQIFPKEIVLNTIDQSRWLNLLKDYNFLMSAFTEVVFLCCRRTAGCLRGEVTVGVQEQVL